MYVFAKLKYCWTQPITHSEISLFLMAFPPHLFSPKHLHGTHITPHPNIQKQLKIKQTPLLINLGCFRQIKSLYFRHTSFLLFIIYDLFFDFLLEVKIPAIPEAKATKLLKAL